MKVQIVIYRCRSCPKFENGCVCLSLFLWAAAYRAAAGRQCVKEVLILVSVCFHQNSASLTNKSFQQMNSYEFMWLSPENCYF